MTATRPFRAFVSYCHADVKFAAWLQRKLESYRLPRRLADRVQPLEGQAAGRIGPVFRDRADLSAAEDLSAAVKEAIAASSALIVVASPDAANSHWVAREIALFRALHPGAPILVALTQGEPAEAFPPSLQNGGTEPLAADFRKAGDGKRLALLKMVSALAGLPLDALVQRDAQRQLRRVTAVTVAVSLVAIAMAALLLVALQARAEAERRRVGAETLVEFMRTTLREQLKGEGSVKVMRAVNEQALAYFDGEDDAASLGGASALNRAMVLHALGEDELNGGRLIAAQRRFLLAFQATRDLLAQNPRSGDAIFVHAQSEFWMGRIAWERRARNEASRFWQNYRRQAEALARVEPGSFRGLMEMGFAEGNLCDLNYADKYDLASALRHCRESIRYVSAAARGKQQDKSTVLALANRYGWLAKVQLALGDHGASFTSRQQEAALIDGLIASDPQNVDYAMRRSWADLGMGKILMDTGRPAQAARLLAGTWELFAKRLSDDKSKDFWKSGLKVLLFLKKARRLAGLAHRSEAALADTWEARLLTLFPDPKTRTEFEMLKRDIEKGG